MKKLTKRYNKRNSVEAYNCLCWMSMTACSCNCIACGCSGNDADKLTVAGLHKAQNSISLNERAYYDHLAENFNGDL